MTPRKTAATAPKKTAAKAPAAAPERMPMATEQDVDGRTVFRLDESPAVPVDGPRIPLFYIGATEYSMPAEVSTNEAVQVLRDVSVHGPVFAGVLLMERLVGRPAVDRALRVTSFNEWGHITTVATNHVLGALREASKN